MSADHLSTDLVLGLATSAVQTTAEFQKCKIILDQNITRLKSDVKQEAKKIERLEAGIKLARTKIENYHDKLQSIQKELPELDNDLTSITQRAKNVHEESSEICKRYDETNAKLKHLDSMLTTFAQSASGFDHHMESVLIHRAGDTVKKYKELKDTLNSLQVDDPKDLEESIKQGKVMIDNLTNEVNELKNDIKSLTDEKEFYTNYTSSLLTHLDPSRSILQTPNISQSGKKILFNDLALLRYMHDLNDQLDVPHEPTDTHGENDVIWSLMGDLEEFAQTFCEKLAATISSIHVNKPSSDDSSSSDSDTHRLESFCSHCIETTILHEDEDAQSSSTSPSQYNHDNSDITMSNGSFSQSSSSSSSSYNPSTDKSPMKASSTHSNTMCGDIENCDENMLSQPEMK